MEACGTIGGILMVWDKRSLELLDKEVGSYLVSCRFKNVEDGFVWVFSGVYGPFTREGRTDFWEELESRHRLGKNLSILEVVKKYKKMMLFLLIE